MLLTKTSADWTYSLSALILVTKVILSLFPQGALVCGADTEHTVAILFQEMAGLAP